MRLPAAPQLADARPAVALVLAVAVIGGAAALGGAAFGASAAGAAAAALAALAPGAAAVAWREHRRARALERRNEAAAKQLDRRIAELFSLQELSYILSESIQLERIVEQVARYAARFLQADGALIAMTERGEGGRLRIVAATGALARFQGRLCEPHDGALAQLAIVRERIEVAQGVATPTVHLLGGISVRSAAVAPLRAQGEMLGALAVADRHDGQFTTEDLWLLSTVATQASVVVANSRLYEMVRRSTEEWETAFDALAEGIAVVAADGKVVRANRALAALAGLPEPELLGRDFADAVAGGAALARDLFAHSPPPGARPLPVEVRRDSDRRVLRLTAAPLTGPTARGAAVILVEDVTEQRTMEAQLIQNEKMASIGQLVSGVAHELNNPLTSIAGLAELLLEPNRVPTPVRDHLRVIHDQAERASRIVRNLLTFARKGTPEKEMVDLNDVVARTALLISYEMKLRSIELDCRVADGPVLVFADRYELQQVLLNLVTNAVHAVTELEPGRPRRIVLSTARLEAGAELRVTDTGSGVPPALVPHLFTPFFTTKGAGHGTGLGLSLSYGLVESHGGRLAYRPGADGGAEFVVTLPVHAAEPVEPLRAAAAEASPRERAKRVLVVDEDPAVPRVLSALFAPDGFAVEAARSGEQGMRMARRRRYDLVIADGQMALDGGRPFALALLEEHPEARERLIVTSTARSSSPRLPLAAHHVTKPFNLRDLRALAGRILAA
ncbi:MAG TPA: ATP-binding protein [Gemmatimonadales bacterium]|nr:ATP-binding protein [Gemmatimonadales bacterium]